VSRTDEEGHGGLIEIAYGTHGTIPLQEGRPSRVLLPLQSRAPSEHGEVVGAVPETAAVEVVEREYAVLVDVPW
jgi:hypothetical protein